RKREGMSGMARTCWRRGARHAVALSLVVAAGSAPLLAEPRGSPSLAAEREVEPGGRVLDDFADLTKWTAVASAGPWAFTHSAEGLAGRALRLDFDLAGSAGFALARRSLPLDLPPRYEVSFYVRADDERGGGLQLKLADASGENVWWFNRPDFRFSRQWQ